MKVAPRSLDFRNHCDLVSAGTFLQVHVSKTFAALGSLIKIRLIKKKCRQGCQTFAQIDVFCLVIKTINLFREKQAQHACVCINGNV